MTSPLQQKLKITGPVVVTANRLRDGAVVYRTATGAWTADLNAAAVVTTSEAAHALLAGAVSDGLNAVDAYVAPVDLVSGRPQPANLRERIRRAGPTFPIPGAFPGEVGTGSPSGNATKERVAFPGEVGTGSPSGNATKERVAHHVRA